MHTNQGVPVGHPCKVCRARQTYNELFRHGWRDRVKNHSRAAHEVALHNTPHQAERRVRVAVHVERVILVLDEDVRQPADAVLQSNRRWGGHKHYRWSLCSAQCARWSLMISVEALGNNRLAAVS